MISKNEKFCQYELFLFNGKNYLNDNWPIVKILFWELLLVSHAFLMMILGRSFLGMRSCEMSSTKWRNRRMKRWELSGKISNGNLGRSTFYTAINCDWLKRQKRPKVSRTNHFFCSLYNYYYVFSSNCQSRRDFSIENELKTT